MKHFRPSVTGGQFSLLALALAALCLPGAQAADGGRNLSVAKVEAGKQVAQRVALVIGNASYTSAPLSNPVNDARAIAQSLRESGFAVTLVENASFRDMLGRIREFGDQLRKGGVGVFYYAGHGMQIKGRNYLIPIGATIEREDEVAYAAVDAQAVLDKMDAAGNGTNVMILDACRNNPFARSFRSAQQGLAQMDAPVGTLVAFATAPGSVASDGSGNNGLYTQHLLEAIREPGVKIEDVFKRVRVAVRRDSQGKQVPWESTSLEGDFYFKPLKKPDAGEQDLEKAMWALVKDSSSVIELKAYLGRFPQGAFAAQAASRLAQLEKPVAALAASSTHEAQSDEKREEVAWNKVKESSKPEALKSFLAKFGQGRYAAEARARLSQLEAARRPEEKPAAPAVSDKTGGFQVGDRWNFQVVDRYKGEVIENWSRKITEVLPGGEALAGKIRLTPEGNIISLSSNKFESRNYSAANLLVPKTLKVGHSEEIHFTDLAKRKDGYEFEQEWKGKLTVKGLERVKVPAGEFDAYRIEREAWVTGIQRSGADRWTALNQVTLWYVPTLRYWVALEESHKVGRAAPDVTRTELTSYALK